MADAATFRSEQILVKALLEAALAHPGYGLYPAYCSGEEYLVILG
ncbi:hypothetical protein [Pyrofollis japonicus]|nr:hypothetical protein [Pyrofollis japonicus]